MSDAIYLLRGEDDLVEMREQLFEKEDILQRLIERFPNLLAGDQMGAQSPRQWLLVKREAGVPDHEGAADRWSVDHLFLDQDAVPTLVEVKRSTDSRIRREMIGQMFDYAANVVVYWPVERLRETFVRRCAGNGIDPDDEVRSSLDLEGDVQAFWQRADENLRAGNVRLVFVSDEIPRETRRVIEFLNGQMNPAVVIGIEVKQYVGEGGVKTLVPRVIGQTAAAEALKGRRVVGERRQWDEESLFADLEARHGVDVTHFVRDLYDWTLANRMRPKFGVGANNGSWSPIFESGGTEYSPIILSTYGLIYIRFQHLRTRPPFDNELMQRELLRHVNEIPGVSFEADVLDMESKGVRLSTLAAERGGLQAFEEFLSWIVATAGAPTT